VNSERVLKINEQSASTWRKVVAWITTRPFTITPYFRQVAPDRKSPQSPVHRSPFTVHAAPRALSALTLMLVLPALTACGFALRGSYELPYQTIHVTSTGSSVVAGQIRRELTDTKTRVVPSAKDADAALTILEERRDRQILSLSGAGRVREFELRMKVTYQFIDGKGATIIPTSEIILKRTFAYDDTRVIAKQQEEAMLYQDMERDATGQIIRRMIAVGRG
jgi:LPS-assembly lipoprotein